MTQVHVTQGEGMCVRRVSLHLGRKTTVRVGPRTYAYVMCWNVGLLAARRVNRGSRSRPIRLRHETIALFQNKNKRPQSLPDESGPLTINRSSMFVLILSRQKPFSIHITIQVKVILAVMKQLKELETEPRKKFWGSNVLDLLPTRLQLGVQIPLEPQNFSGLSLQRLYLLNNCKNHLREASNLMGSSS